MAITVQGIGWLTKEGYGCIRSELRHDYETGEGAHTLPKKDIFSHPFKNFGRLDALSKMTAYAVSLALQDAGIEYSPIRKQNIGIVGTNAEGSLRSDIEYFRDYLEGGRTLSRGNLFIYTLPSSPLGEAGDPFWISGAAPVCGPRERRPGSRPRSCERDAPCREAPVMLAGTAEADEAMFFVLERDSGDDRRSSVTWPRPELLWKRKRAPVLRGWCKNYHSWRQERDSLKIKLIYPKWPKLERQTEFHLPPHGPICFAATVPVEHELSFVDEHLEKIDFDEKLDLVAISCMLTCQIKARMGDRGPISRQGNSRHLRRHRHDAACRGNHAACRLRVPRRGRRPLRSRC